MRGKQRKRPTYDDKFRASAVVMLKSQGYPEMKGSLTFVAKHLHVPLRTLSRWFNGENNPPPDIDVNEKTFDMRAALQAELEAIIGAMPTARIDASYSQLGTVLGIVFDKMRLLDGLPTEIKQMLPGLAKAYEKHGEKASEAFERLIQRMLVDD